jgi:hypothetical protein
MRKYEKHGLSAHELYTTWKRMIQRCTNVNDHKYPEYGGRGVTVCETWRTSFPAFLADMGERPRGMTLDRIDPNKGYEPGNCRWASKTVQSINTRLNKRNALGLAGIRFRAEKGSYHVTIMVANRQIHIGTTPDFFEACCLRKSAEHRYRDHLLNPYV